VNEALLVSNLLLWLAVLALGAVVVALVRQVGVLHERVAPAGALMLGGGPKVGETTSPITVPLLDGHLATLGGPSEDGRAALLFFLSPTCPVCKALLPALHSLARSEAARLRVVYASDGDADIHRAFARDARLDAGAYALSRELGMHYEVGKLPFAALVDGAGVLRAKGIVNTREHLESLLEAMERGVASLQEHLERDEAAGGTR